jgi:UPF0755 protein
MKRILIFGALLVIVAGGLLAWKFYGWINHPNTQRGNSNVIFIHDTTNFVLLREDLISQKILISPKSFDWVARRMDFDDTRIKKGRYYLQAGLSNYQLIQKLRLGQQDAIDLIINSSHTLEELAGSLSRQLASDSLAYLAYIRDTFIPQNAYQEETILSLFIPNTYQVWWSVTPRKLIDRMTLEHERFWNAERLAKAEHLTLTPTEVYTLASIVESETQVHEERRTIAGVYLNRIRQHIPLQADPTIRFALQDPTIRRILYRHLELDSPYNTYLYPGLPPGPISMPSIQSIDAVLDAEEHEYLFFCARPGYDGRHLFAKNLRAHMANARVYQTWLNEQGIR